MEDLIKEMEANTKKQLHALAKADADIVAKVKAEEDKNKKALEAQLAETEKQIKDAINKIAKDIEDSEKDKPEDESKKEKNLKNVKAKQ